MLFIKENPRAWLGLMKAGISTLDCKTHDYFERGEAWAKEHGCYEQLDHSQPGKTHYDLYLASLRGPAPYIPQHMRRFTADLLGHEFSEGHSAPHTVMDFPARSEKQRRGISSAAVSALTASRKTASARSSVTRRN